MADPIRQPVSPPRPHPPIRVRPRRALHRTLAVPDEGKANLTAGPEPPARPVQAPPLAQAPPPRPAPEQQDKPSVMRRAVTTERALRAPLLLTLGLHVAALLALLLAAGSSLSRSDLLLAAAVVGSASVMLAVGALWGRRG